MTDYPRTLDLEPIADWPGELRTSRVPSQFKSTLGQTMRELASEIDHLRGTEPRLAIAVTAEQIRLDGRLRAGERPWHPGVILIFQTPKGEMRYPSDAYTKWEDNLRAIAKTLEALRAIDRWKVTTGQQYGGFLAIESSESARFAAPAGFHSRDEVNRFLTSIVGDTAVDDEIGSGYVGMLRKAKRITHPDVGGDADQFDRVNLAEAYLKQNGYI